MSEVKGLADIALMLGRVESKIDAMSDRQSRHDNDLEKLDRRVTALEHAKLKVMGAAAAVGAGASLAIKYFTGTHP